MCTVKLRVSSEQLLDNEDAPDKTTPEDPMCTVPATSCHITPEESIPVLITTKETCKPRTSNQETEV